MADDGDQIENGNGIGGVAPAAISRICSRCHRDVATLPNGRIRIMPRSMQHFCEPLRLMNWVKLIGERDG